MLVVGGCRSALYFTHTCAGAASRTLLGVAAASLHPLARHLHSRRINRNIEFLTASDVQLPRNTLKMGEAAVEGSRVEERPLTLLFCWLMAKERHVRKYAEMYTRWGMDVLRVRVSPFDLLRPMKGSQVVAGQVLDFLHANPRHSPIVVHGLSVGAYVCMEAVVQMQQNPQQHGGLMERFVGQVWDSAVDVEGIPDGIPRALTSNSRLQRKIKKYLLWYLQAAQHTATIHYNSASAAMHSNGLGCPALFLFSDNDPVSTPAMNQAVYTKWERRNTPVFVKCWNGSPHVSHYLKHRQEYEDQVEAFLETIGVLESCRQHASSV